MVTSDKENCFLNLSKGYRAVLISECWFDEFSLCIECSYSIVEGYFIPETSNGRARKKIGWATKI